MSLKISISLLHFSPIGYKIWNPVFLLLLCWSYCFKAVKRKKLLEISLSSWNFYPKFLSERHVFSSVSSCCPYFGVEEIRSSCSISLKEPWQFCCSLIYKKPIIGSECLLCIAVREQFLICNSQELNLRHSKICWLFPSKIVRDTHSCWAGFFNVSVESPEN